MLFGTLINYNLQFISSLERLEGVCSVVQLQLKPEQQAVWDAVVAVLSY